MSYPRTSLSIVSLQLVSHDDDNFDPEDAVHHMDNFVLATTSMFSYLCIFKAQLRTMPFIGLEPLCNLVTIYKTFVTHSIATSKQFDIIDVPTLQILYIQTTNHKPTDIQQQRCPPSSPSPP